MMTDIKTFIILIILLGFTTNKGMAQTTMPDTIYIKCNLLQKFPEGQWQKVSDTEILYLQDVGATSYLSVRSHKYLTYEEYNALEFTFMEKLAKALNISQKGEYSNLHKKMPKLFLVMDPDSVIDGIEVLEVVDWSIIRHQTRHPAMFFYCDELEKQKLIDGVVHFWQVRYFEMSDDECDFRAEWHINSIKSPNITDPNPEKMFVFSGDIPYKVVDEEWVKSVKRQIYLTSIVDTHIRASYINHPISILRFTSYTSTTTNTTYSMLYCGIKFGLYS